MKTVFFDVDTQIDFMFPAGALYVPGAEGILPAVGRLNRFAAGNGVALISTVDAHSENDVEFLHWPPHCVVGCNGQRKPAQTLVESQILLEKQTFDCFSNLRLPGLLRELGADRYVVYGVVTEICVKLAAFGLLKTGTRVEIISDAVRSLSDGATGEMLAEFRAAGGVVTEIGAVLGYARNVDLRNRANLRI